MSKTPGKLQIVVEKLYMLVKNMFDGIVGKKGSSLLPLVFCIFIFIMFINVFGMIPYNFTPTSHLVFNLIISISFMSVITLYGIFLHGMNFFTLFIPSGIPTLIVPFIAIIEVISYCIRPFSLAIRLTANMTIGHIILKLIAKLILTIIKGSLMHVLLGVFILPLFGVLFVILLQETFVALLQSYVFVLLSCIYTKDVVKLH